MAGISGPELLARMVTQYGDIAVNNGFTTGQSTLTIALDRNYPVWLIDHDSPSHGGDEPRLTGMSADDKVDAVRVGTSGNASRRYAVVGVRK